MTTADEQLAVYLAADQHGRIFGAFLNRDRAREEAYRNYGSVVAVNAGVKLVQDFRVETRREAKCQTCHEPIVLIGDVWLHAGRGENSEAGACLDHRGKPWPGGKAAWPAVPDLGAA